MSVGLGGGNQTAACILCFLGENDDSQLRPFSNFAPCLIATVPLIARPSEAARYRYIADHGIVIYYAAIPGKSGPADVLMAFSISTLLGVLRVADVRWRKKLLG